MRCPDCGFDNPGGAMCCAQCGRQLPQSKLKSSMGKNGNEKESPSFSQNQSQYSFREPGWQPRTENIAFSGNDPVPGNGPIQGSDDGGRFELRPTGYCPNCGAAVFDGQSLCPACRSAAKGGEGPRSGIDIKKLLPVIIIGAALLIAVIVVLLCGSGDNDRNSKDSSGGTVSYSTGTPKPSKKPAAAPAASKKPAATYKPAPTVPPAEAPATGPGPADLKGVDSRIERPESGNWLREYTTMYVCSEGGVSIYLCYGPQDDPFDTVNEGEAVTVMAQRYGFSLVETRDGRVGWCSSDLLAEDNDLFLSMPGFNNTYWTWQHGSGYPAYACLFYTNGTYSAYSYAEDDYHEADYSISGRRLKMDGARYIWNGECFVSSEMHTVNNSTDYIYLYPDTAKNYHDMEWIYQHKGIDGM